jgi:lysozyme
VSQGGAVRIVIAAAAFSAAGFAALVGEEFFVAKATIPTKNDRCTNGFGSTFKEDGSPVKCGEVITPVQAVKRTQNHLAKTESKLKTCITGDTSREEFDLLVKFSYQYGEYATCKSAMVKYTNEGNYVAACNAYLLYKFSGGYDCTTLINGSPNKRCYGVHLRNLERQSDCLAAQ